MAAKKNQSPKPVRLTNRGVAVVSLVAAGCVVLAANGFAAQATLIGIALYLLVSGRGAAVARKVPAAKSALRALCWASGSVVALMAVQGTTAPGGPTFGLALVAAMFTALKLTGTRRVR